MDDDISNVDIVVGDTSPVKMDPSEANVTTAARKRMARRDRRKNKQDRRKSVREGIIVSLSVDKERRVARDRRKVQS
ncbi:MAG: hypothetical protein HWN68_08615 [Desulfobacterales bacterium]|nr:hypothetical protein [Desulfobacterales bacterium]